MTKGNRLAISGLVLSALGATGITQYEGYRDKAYLDQGGVPTIGYGTTINVRIGDTITKDRALTYLKAHAAADEVRMKKCIGDVPLYQHEWDAYVSFSYNVGWKAFCGSSVVRKLHETPPNYSGACDAMLPWNKIKGKINKGLVNRRTKEHAICAGVKAL